ncbi:MAG: NADH-quinone oxidoreductase subunit J [Candidatus Eisenbacteria bacterium]
MGSVAFWILSAVAVGSAVFTVTRKNPLSAALSLVVCLAAIAGLFATLSAHFLFVIQLLVYAGAVMVLVIYVIMVLNLEEREMRVLGLSRPRVVLAVIASVPVAVVLVRVTAGGGAAPAGAGDFGSIESIGGVLFTRYLFPFEVVSVLLLAAMVGAVVLVLRRF